MRLRTGDVLLLPLSANMRDLIEQRLFAHRRDLSTRLDLVFKNTTSPYFAGVGEQAPGRRRHALLQHG